MTNGTKQLANFFQYAQEPIPYPTRFTGRRAVNNKGRDPNNRPIARVCKRVRVSFLDAVSSAVSIADQEKSSYTGEYEA